MDQIRIYWLLSDPWKSLLQIRKSSIDPYFIRPNPDIKNLGGPEIWTIKFEYRVLANNENLSIYRCDIHGVFENWVCSGCDCRECSNKESLTVNNQVSVPTISLSHKTWDNSIMKISPSGTSHVFQESFLSNYSSNNLQMLFIKSPLMKWTSAGYVKTNFPHHCLGIKDRLFKFFKFLKCIWSSTFYMQIRCHFPLPFPASDLHAPTACAKRN